MSRAGSLCHFHRSDHRIRQTHPNHKSIRFPIPRSGNNRGSVLTQTVRFHPADQDTQKSESPASPPEASDAYPPGSLCLHCTSLHLHTFPQDTSFPHPPQRYRSAPDLLVHNRCRSDSSRCPHRPRSAGSHPMYFPSCLIPRSSGTALQHAQR